MKISIRELRRTAEFLEGDASRVCDMEDMQTFASVAEYLRYVADQREEFEARQRDADPRMKKLKAALAQVWSARNARLAGRA